MTHERDITDLLVEAGNGDRRAHEEVVGRVYDELHNLAERYLAYERRDHTLQPTALVHEAYLRLADQDRVSWCSRSQFYAVAAQMMRRILVDHARVHRSMKRGGRSERIDLGKVEAEVSFDRNLDLVALDEALHRLASFDPKKARIVELRFFAGLTVDEIAEMLDVSARTVFREWRIARVWLFDQVTRGDADEHGDVARCRTDLPGSEPPPAG